MPWPFSKKKKSFKNPHSPKAKALPSKKKFIKHSLTKKEYSEWQNASGVNEVVFDKDVIIDKAHFLKKFFASVTRYWPVASAASWTWTNLCNTKQKLSFIGGTPQENAKAVEVIANLNKRISPFKYVKLGGMDLIIQQYFHYLFTYGRYSSDIVLDDSLSEIGNVKINDPFKVLFDKQLNAFYEINGEKAFPVNENSFYFIALNMDVENPYGFAFIETSWSLMKIADEMFADMKNSSSNAGTPRLHIKVTQPDKAEDEDEEDYVKRVGSYFDSYIDQLADIAPDDNFYSWDDVEIGIAGGDEGQAFVWKTNRQLLDEEILAGFHLFAWIVGKTASTTKNWVTAQFNLLMAQIESLQLQASKYVEWIYNTELLLKGINNVKVKHSFIVTRDPAAKDMAVAERFKIINVKLKILAGFVSADDGARELGLEKAHDPERIFGLNKKKDSDSPIGKDDNELSNDVSETLNILNEISASLENIDSKTNERE